ncbi:adenine phosphoribosyltransferase [Tsukamurella pseudospumae]|uniref:Adenine phosphoribosyltransferase n=1 Tax=Tsukamurella pseudospumae TaxID=239498 RepID=A0A138AWB2_9ACTN|nr:adenine phosphoribosyltransferase [Tsukamurella pseudospumae]KXP14751.1 adenine phosphoribosyltransferase [Tsukamurella pseudospumae]
MTDTPGRSEAARAVAEHTRHVADFPAPGVVFADLTPVFADGAALAAVIDGLADAGRGSDGAVTVDLVAGLDARGFLLGSGVALALGVGTLAVRKAGKLPPPVLHEEYELEYGTAALEIPAEGIALQGKRILIVDDVLATGGTVSGAVALLRRGGAIVERVSVVLELEALGGRARLGQLPGGPIAVSTISVG